MASSGRVDWLGDTTWFVVLDIDNDKWEERLDAVKAICIKHGLFPPIHKTNKGVHVFL